MIRRSAARRQRLPYNLMRYLVLAATLLLHGCDGDTSGKPRDRALAEAFTGPIQLELRQEITPNTKTVATAKHGEKLEILQVRRRFVRVRTPRGQEGWTDSRNLLTAEQMRKLQELAAEAKRLPSQGEAMVYSALNMHTDPSRQSTSFHKITEGMRVDVVGHRLTARTNEPPPAFRIPKPPPRASAKKAKKEPAVPPPPRPPSPGLPENWREISKTVIPEPPPAPEPIIPAVTRKSPRASRAAAVKAVRMDDWYLVRTKDGRAGWILASMSHLAIPDEVAQYSEGARITSYGALADVQDAEMTKHHWIWTTIREGSQPYQFDSFRVFTYVVRKHRYETAYIERDLEGYYPLLVERGKLPQFSLVTREEDGQLHRKTYVLEGHLVRRIKDELYKPGQDEPGRDVISELQPEDQGAEAQESRSLLDRVRGMFGRKSD